MPSLDHRAPTAAVELFPSRPSYSVSSALPVRGAPAVSLLRRELWSRPILPAARADARVRGRQAISDRPRAAGRAEPARVFPSLLAQPDRRRPLMRFRTLW